MLIPKAKTPNRPADLDWAVTGIVLLVVAGCLLLWLGGQAASLLSGNGFAAGPVTSGARALLADRDHPAAAWDSAMPDAPAYWWITTISIAALVALTVAAVVKVRGGTRRRSHLAEMESRPGMATARAIRAAVGPKRLRRSAPELRPTLDGRISPRELGWCWGTARGVSVWTSVRDSVVLLGPSGAGKGVYVVNNRILDAPAAVVATSTRPDVLSVTISQRRQVGPVAVIATDGSMDGLPEIVRWSPIQGCRDGRIAAARAQVLAAGSSSGVEDASFWQGWTEKVIKTLLHAAAWSNTGIDDLWRWSQSAVAARSALAALQDLDGRDTGSGERVEPGWADTLAQVVEGDDKFRGNVWAGVGKSLAGLDLHSVRRRFDPCPGDNFDPTAFLASRGTLYLLAEADDPASRLLQCLVADITRTAKDLADHSPRSRLDPPLTLVLDEIANWAPLPALPTYVSAYGGSGVVTIAVIQSRAQMARSWGSDAAKAIWDSATITGILGGVTDAENLRDFAAIAGDRDETSWQASTGKGDGLLGLGSGRSYSEQTRTRAVLTTGEIRGLPEGTMLMFYKGLDPMLVRMTAYYRRKDRTALLAGREEVESTITRTASAEPVVAEPPEEN
ncbi:type IV secretory system conjugative DNA transfer family protein [Nakamurella sp.]|uniref:type IV secretory system conjugative DNA transfer family protein n=1 Tax=Nakamurella sp. TaxID=1869182 RepID=UPI003B3B6B9A